MPLKLVEKPDPVAIPGSVVIDIKASGLCHSDGKTEQEAFHKFPEGSRERKES